MTTNDETANNTSPDGSSCCSHSIDLDAKALLGPCVTASSIEELILALENLSKNIKSIDVGRDQKQEVATFLVKEITVSSLSSETLQQKFDQCLDACGLLLVVTDVYVPLLLEVASPPPLGTTTNMSSTTASDSSSFGLQTVLQQIQRLFLSIPNSSDHLLINLLVQEYQKQRQDEEGTKITKSTTNSTYIEYLCNTILRLPVQIAAACHTQQLILPTWAVRSRFYTRLVECAMMAALVVADRDNDTAEERSSDTIMNATQTYVTSLLPSIMNYGGGGGGRTGTGDPIALGLYRSYQQILLTGGIMGNTTLDGDSSRSDEDQQELFSKLIFQSIQSLLPNNAPQCAILLSSILKQSLSTIPGQQQQQQQKRPKNLLPYKQHIISYLQVTCQHILRYSHQIRGAFIRLVLLSRSPTSLSPQLLTFEAQSVAILLSKCDHDCSFTSATDYDADADDSDTDEDDNNTIGNNVLRKSMELVAQTWCETLFVQHTDTRQQQYITEFLRAALLLLPSPNDNSQNQDYKFDTHSSILVSSLLQGVSVRLNASIYEIRKDGMVIGELLSKQLGQELHFDELNEKDREIAHDNDVRNIVNGDLMKCIPNDDLGEETLSTSSRRAPAMPPATLDPDEEYVSDDSSDDDDDSDDNDDSDDYIISTGSNGSSPHDIIKKSDGDKAFNSEEDGDSSLCYSDDENVLLPYNLEDDEEDLRETPRPLYLRDCLDLFRASNEEDNAYSSHQTALQEVAKLVRSKPLDLPDLAASLAKELLFMEDKFNLAKFAELRQSGLVALAVEEPLPVSTVFIGDLFENIDLGTRLDCLATLQQAAYELSGSKALHENRDVRNKRFQSEMINNAPKISGSRRLVQGNKEESPEDVVTGGTDHVERAITSIESRTRRWGKGRQKITPSLTVSNRFGPIAPLQFYSLLGEFVKCKEYSCLWSGANGARLLASCLITLATFVECSGVHSGADVLAKHLFELAWSFRSVEASEVRSAVLVALASCVPFLHSAFLVNVLNGQSVDSFSEFLSKSVTEDPDQNCRRLARVIAKSLGTLMSSLEFGTERNSFGFTTSLS